MTLSLVSTVTVGSGGAASIEFTGIPQTATDLYLVISGRSAYASGSSAALQISVNASATGYVNKILAGTGSAVLSSSGSTAYVSGYLDMPAATSTANTFGNTALTIPNYTSSVAKTFSLDTVGENNAAAAVQVITAGSWSGTAAITSVKAAVANGFVEYSTASLYTVQKGSGGASVA